MIAGLNIRDASTLLISLSDQIHGRLCQMGWSVVCSGLSCFEYCCYAEAQSGVTADLKKANSALSAMNTARLKPGTDSVTVGKLKPVSIINTSQSWARESANWLHLLADEIGPRATLVPHLNTKLPHQPPL